MKILSKLIAVIALIVPATSSVSEEITDETLCNYPDVFKFMAASAKHDVIYDACTRLLHASDASNKSIVPIINTHANFWLTGYMSTHREDVFDGAVTQFKLATSIDPSYALSYSNLGFLYAFKFMSKNTTLPDDDSENAIAAYGTAIKLEPNNPSLFTLRGSMFFRTNNIPNAIVDYTKAIELGDKTPNVLCRRANAYLKAGKPDLAIDDFKQAQQIDPAYYGIQAGLDQAMHDKQLQ